MSLSTFHILPQISTFSCSELFAVLVQGKIVACFSFVLKNQDFEELPQVNSTFKNIFIVHPTCNFISINRRSSEYYHLAFGQETKICKVMLFNHTSKVCLLPVVISVSVFSVLHPSGSLRFHLHKQPANFP